MTYPPQPGGYGQPDPYGQQPGYGQQPPYGQPPQSGPPADPVTGAPQSPGPYGQPTSGGQPPYGQPAYGPPPGQPGYPPGGFPPPAPPQPAGERPGKVTAAVVCMLAVAVIWVITSVAGIIGNNIITDNLASICDGDPACLAEMENTTGNIAGNIAGNILGFVLLVAFLVVAVFTMQGHIWARIVSFVANGLSIALNCCVSGTSTLGLMLVTRIDQELESEGAEHAVSDLLPGWLLPVSITGAVITLILNIVAIVLLANKESGAWFKAKDAQRHGRIG